jgi:periplasmic copper chaperone A
MAIAAASVVLVVVGAAGPAQAQEATAGLIRITHPFATPTIGAATTGAAYFTALENTGAKPDRLLRASTPVAARVEMHTMSVDAQGVMRMREIEAIDVPVKQPVKMRPGMGLHLMLIGLREPLKVGSRFAMTLQFERAGPVEVMVVVQAPDANKTASDAHMH